MRRSAPTAHALLPYIPQLPLEWAGLALGVGAWLLQRRPALTGREGLALLALTACVAARAAVIETVAVPTPMSVESRVTWNRCRTRFGEPVIWMSTRQHGADKCKKSCEHIVRCCGTVPACRAFARGQG